jgi:hypothetical protein
VKETLTCYQKKKGFTDKNLTVRKMGMLEVLIFVVPKYIVNTPKRSREAGLPDGIFSNQNSQFG